MSSVTCGRSTCKLTWEQIVRLYRLTLDQLSVNTRARYNVCPTMTIDRRQFLGANTLSAQRPFNATFEERLRELGWMDGRKIKIEYRRAEGRVERYTENCCYHRANAVEIIIIVVVAASGCVCGSQMPMAIVH